jgi:hypothetical protein
METGETPWPAECACSNHVMMTKLSTETTCMLCGEPLAIEHSVTIIAIDVTGPVRCCVECYAMFCDLRTVLQLMPSALAKPTSCNGRSEINRKGGVLRRVFSIEKRNSRLS